MAVGLTHCDPKRHAAKAADDIPESIFEDWLALGLLCNGDPNTSEGTPSSGRHAMIETVRSPSSEHAARSISDVYPTGAGRED